MRSSGTAGRDEWRTALKCCCIKRIRIAMLQGACSLLHALRTAHLAEVAVANPHLLHVPP